MNGKVNYTRVDADGNGRSVTETLFELVETLEFFASSTQYRLQINDRYVTELMVYVDEKVRSEGKVRKYVYELFKLDMRGDVDD